MLAMETVLPFILLVVGFVLLIKGADWLIEGGSGLAKKLHVSPMIIGLTVLAFGTSLPELVVNIFASIEDKSAITIGNVIGSNIANIGLILGITAVISTITVHKRITRREGPFLILTSLILLVFFSDEFLSGRANMLSRGESLGLLVLFVVFIYSIVKMKGVESERDDTPEKRGMAHLISLGVLGLIGVSYGGDMVTDNASLIALMLGMSEVLIGLTIVSLGTSLPELAASISAAKKGYPDMAVGNVVGSNIFNSLLIFGVSGSIRPIAFASSNYVDFFIMIGFTVLLFLFTFKSFKVTKPTGALLLVLYLSYIGFVVWRG